MKQPYTETSVLSLPSQATITSALQKICDLFTYAGLPTPFLDARLLLCHVLNISHSQLLIETAASQKPENVLSFQFIEKLQEVVQRRLNKEPIAYILGYQDFMSSRFFVSSDVLIPRPETELIITVITEIIKERQQTDKLSLLDIGTGSGCLPISVQKLYPRWTVSAWDICPKALAVARLNAQNLNCQAITFHEQDALALEAWTWDGASYDFIISNPPYIAKEEASDLLVDVYQYEPHLALFADEAGMKFYRHYAAHAFKKLKQGGCLILEVGYQQAQQVAKLFQGRNNWGDIHIYKDLSGIERVIAIFSKEPNTHGRSQKHESK